MLGRGKENTLSSSAAAAALRSPARPRTALSPVIANLQKNQQEWQTPVVPKPTGQSVISQQKSESPPPPIHLAERTPLKAPVVRVVGSASKKNRLSSEGESIESLRSQLEEERTEQANMRKRVADLITKTMSKSLVKEQESETKASSSDRNYFALVELLNAVKQDRAREQRESQEQIDFLETQLAQVQSRREESSPKAVIASPQTDRFSPQTVSTSSQCQNCSASATDLKKSKSELTEALNLVDARNLQIKELTSKMATADLQNQHLTQENRRLTMDLSTDEKGMKSMYALQNDLIQEIQKQKQAIGKLHAIREELETKLNKNEATSNQLRNAMQMLEGKAAMHKQDLFQTQGLKEENARLAEEVQRLRQQNKDQVSNFDKQMANVTQQVSDIREKYHKVRDENFAVSGKQVEMDKTVIALHKEKAAAEQRVERVSQQRAEAEAKIGQLLQDKQRVEAMLAAAQQLHAVSEQSSSSLRSDNEKLAAQVRESEVARRSAASTRAELQAARAESEKLAAQLSEAEEAAQRLREDNLRLQAAAAKRLHEAAGKEKVIIPAEVKVVTQAAPPPARAAPAAAAGAINARGVVTELPGHCAAPAAGERQRLSFFSGSAPPLSTPAGSAPTKQAVASPPALIRAPAPEVPSTPTTDFGDSLPPAVEELGPVEPAPPRLLTPPRSAQESDGTAAEGQGVELAQEFGADAMARGGGKTEERGAGEVEPWEVGMHSVELTADGKIVPIKKVLPTLTEDPIAELGSPAMRAPHTEGGADATPGSSGGGVAAMPGGLGVMGKGRGGVLGMQM